MSYLTGVSGTINYQQLSQIGGLLSSHFRQQAQILQQTMLPFVAKIEDANKSYVGVMREVLGKRESLKEQAKTQSPGLLSVQKQQSHDIYSPEKMAHDYRF